MKRRHLGLLLILLPCLGANHRSTNFVVTAPTAAVAQQVAQYAEKYRKEKALEWLGAEMPNWPQPCPLTVTVTMEPPSGATTFSFGGGRVQWQKMDIRGPLDRLLASVLPHEVTHTVFAHHFGSPVPRWADEGGSVLSEDDIERKRHDKLIRDILNKGGAFRLRSLFTLRDYPSEHEKVMCMYAQGFSLSDFLVRRSNRQTFLNFVGHGMHYGWDKAAQSYYGHRTVEEMEEAWLKHLRDTKSGAAPIEVAKEGKTPGNPAARTMVRLTVPPIQPLDPEPVVRGAMPASGEVNEKFGTPPPPPPPPLGHYPTNPGWEPVFPTPTIAPVPTDRGGAPGSPPRVKLGPPIIVPGR